MLIEDSENQVLITANPKLYPLEAVYLASSIFLNRAFIFLDENKEGEIVICLKAREKMDKKQLSNLGGEFHNELLNSALRNEISKNNQKLREYIVGRALIGALVEEDELSEEECEECKAEKENDVIEEWDGDSMGIALSWEEQTKNIAKAAKK